MNFFISYDIGDNRLRTRIAKLLVRKGCKRVQKSVYLVLDFSIEERAILHAALKKEMLLRQGASDSVLFIPVEKKYMDGLLWAGDAVVWEALVKEINFFYI